MSENKRYFTTRIIADHILSTSDYVAGRISAVFRLICETDTVLCYELARDDDKEEFCYVVSTTAEQYAKAKTIIEEWYPGLCEFYYPLMISKED